MTNEEKAKEILGCPCYVKRVCKSHPTLCDNCEEKRDLLQMAQWKDAQYAELLAKIAERNEESKMVARQISDNLKQMLKINNQ